MGNCVSKFANKPVTFHTLQLTPRYLKKVEIGIQKNHVKYFVNGIHQSHGYERPKPSIKISLMNVYYRFDPQFFE